MRRGHIEIQQNFGRNTRIDNSESLKTWSSTECNIILNILIGLETKLVIQLPKLTSSVVSVDQSIRGFQELD